MIFILIARLKMFARAKKEGAVENFSPRLYNAFSLHDNNFFVKKLFLYSLDFLLKISVRKA